MAIKKIIYIICCIILNKYKCNVLTFFEHIICILFFVRILLAGILNLSKIGDLHFQFPFNTFRFLDKQQRNKVEI